MPTISEEGSEGGGSAGGLPVGEEEDGGGAAADGAGLAGDAAGFGFLVSGCGCISVFFLFAGSVFSRDTGGAGAEPRADIRRLPNAEIKLLKV
jgi:hypothetical protein